MSKARDQGAPHQIGPYLVERELARGGMGVVYLARDPRLDRPVAIKVLPEEFAADAEVLARFEREAKILASLNDPNIAAIFELEKIDGSYFLILELVEGETLADLLVAGALPVDEALSGCRQVARALEAAHERGVVHRDIKPSNIKITPDGTVKVLDFGVAKHAAQADGPRTSIRWPTGDEDTSAGELLGTPGYMSPEQAIGNPVDRRADIWAFGCVLFECLSGTRAFPGEMAHQRINATLDDQPDWAALSDKTPEAIRALLLRCLEKDPAKRLSDVNEARLEIEEATRARDGGQPSASDQPRHNLPKSLTSFVGRREELTSVADLLGESRIVTLTGVGGCGKTRLALKVASSIRETYANGAWLVELAPVSEGRLIPVAVATALGLREEPGRPLIETLTTHLRQRRLLLVMDNCEHLLGAAAELTEKLLKACPDLRILASSREQLGVSGERSYPVPPLAVASTTEELTVDRLLDFEATRLFVDRTLLVRPEFKPDQADANAIANVCQRLDGIPLAIELAAAWMKVLSAEELATRLDDRFRLLKSGSRTVLPRHQTLRATIDWSYDHLSDAEMTLFRRLSVFAGGWTLDAAEQVCQGDGLDGREILELLTHLVDKSLVVVAKDAGRRYRLLETVREYGRDRLREAARVNATSEAHVRYYLELAERAVPALSGADQVHWLNRLHAEHENLRATLEWCKKGGGSPETGLRLASALWRFWERRGYWGEGRAHLSDFLTRDVGGGMSAERAAALDGAGFLACRQGDYAAARSLCEESLEIHRKNRDENGTAAALEHLGDVCLDQGLFDEAKERYEDSLALRRESGDSHGIARSLNNLGLLEDAQGEASTARQLLAESLALFRKSGDIWGIAVGLNNLALVAKRQGAHDEALELCEESLAISRKIGNRAAEGINLENIAELSLAQTRFDEARGIRSDSMAIFRELGDKAGIARSLVGFAFLDVHQEDATHATHLFGAAEAFREEVGLQLAPSDLDEYEPSVARAKASLGDTAFAAAWAKGRGMSSTDAIQYALRESPPE